MKFLSCITGDTVISVDLMPFEITAPRTWNVMGCDYGAGLAYLASHASVVILVFPYVCLEACLQEYSVCLFFLIIYRFYM